MKKIFFIHFNENELREKIKPIVQAGYRVDCHFSTETIADLRKELPDALIISLDRLPSHGRRYAEWLWEARKRQHIPVIFCGGQPEKTDRIREKLPAAIFCSNDNLLAQLKKIK
jgi:DNA-binding response OmpR family regulator